MTRPTPSSVQGLTPVSVTPVAATDLAPAHGSGFPEHGIDRDTVRRRLAALREADVDWRGGRSALHAYFADAEVLAVGAEAYAEFLSESALAASAFPSVARMEAELVSAGLDLMNAPPGARGALTSGGTESIILALKAARDQRRDDRPGGAEPLEVVAPRTAHPAFDKAAQLLGLKVVRTPTDAAHRADPAAMAAAITPQTVLLVGSAPCLPYGVVDPIAALSDLAMATRLGLHVDACIGGYLAPFARLAGHPVPAFDFSLPGVTSISADLHKFGYVPKGVSAVFCRTEDLHRRQATTFSDWPKGRYQTPTLAGTRSAGPIAGAWAVMTYLGKSGYVRLAGRTMDLFHRYRAAIAELPGIRIVGEPDLACLAFTSETTDLFRVGEGLAQRGWYMSRVAEPRSLHQIVNLVHEQALAAYIADLRAEIAAAARQVAAHEDVNTY